MNITWDKTDAFLRSQGLANEAKGDAPYGGPFVTISRESGAGATSLATALVKRLDQAADRDRPWTVFGVNLIEEMLQAKQQPPRLAQYLPEGPVSEINSLVGEIVGLHPSLWGLIQESNRLTRELAWKGNAIFIGRGAVFTTAGIGHGVHLRLVAPKEFRARRTAERLGISVEAAAAHNRRQDAARRAYVKANFDAHGPDPVAYDLVINTARVPLHQAVETIAAAVSAAGRPVPASRP